MSRSAITRRRALVLAGSLAAGTVASVRSSSTSLEAAMPDDEKFPWIDAHSHIWTTDLAKFPLRNGQTVDD